MNLVLKDLVGSAFAESIISRVRDSLSGQDNEVPDWLYELFQASESRSDFKIPEMEAKKLLSSFVRFFADPKILERIDGLLID